MRLCKHCGKEFHVKNKATQYCSRECGWASIKGPRVIYPQYECKQCGKSFRAQADRTTFCSRECFQRFAKETRLNIKTRICKGCGNEHTRGAQHRYCSEQCKTDSEIRRKVMADFAKAQARQAKQEESIRSLKCAWCGVEFIARKKTLKYCSKVCSLKRQNQSDHQRKDRRHRANGGADFSINLKDLYLRDGGRCHICGMQVLMDGDSNNNYYGSIDHVIPTAKGGTHTWDNIKLAHRICNSVKADKLW
jgi:hypothetical protein